MVWTLVDVLLSVLCSAFAVGCVVRGDTAVCFVDDECVGMLPDLMPGCNGGRTRSAAI